jgi:transcription elongation factor Elf1
MPYSDKKKQKEYQRDFLRRKAEHNPKWHAELQKRKNQNRQVISDIVSQIKRTFGCLLCGENNPDNLQFHHVLPDLKLATVSELVWNRSKLVVILKEIDKCVCVCGGCHKRLGGDIHYIINIIKAEKWYRDWGVQEALDWSSLHPQSRMRKSTFIDVIKAVARNYQIQDFKSFEKVK